MEGNNTKAKRMFILIILFIILTAMAICLALLSRAQFDVKANKKNQRNSESSTERNDVNSKEELVYENSNIEPLELSEDIEVVPTLLDKVTTNSAWCATFQLVWNDMQNKVIKKDIEFTPQIKMVENLNKQSFTEDDISDEYYYKKYGLMTLDLKKEIENGIKDKFDQKSDILDLIDWSDVPKDESAYKENLEKYLFYVMLYREFKFEKAFDELADGKFRGTEQEYDNIKYFGINYSSSKELYDQVKVLYYENEEDFAVILETKEGDEVVLCRGDNGDTFGSIYDSIMKKADKYKGNTSFTKDDTLMVPNIKFDTLKEYIELEGKPFQDSKGKSFEIERALQTIKFELDRTGGKIKSEAAIVTKEMLAAVDIEYRYFNLNSSFTMFLREKNADLPYFAANIDDITLYQ